MSSFQICSVDNDLPGNHNCLVEVKAQVMTRNALGMWVPHAGGGMSRVGLFQAPDAVAAEANLGHVQYVISGYKMSDDVVIMHCTLSRDFQYMKVNPTFHHWSVKEKRFGLTFQTFADATAFEKTINLVMENLRSTGAVKTLPSKDGASSSLRSSPKDTVALPKETEKRPCLPQKMYQRPITQDARVLPNPINCSQPKDRLGSICSLETIPGAGMVPPTLSLARRSSSAEFSGPASVCAHGSSSEAIPPRLPFISSQSKSDSGPQVRPEEGPQAAPDVPPRSKSDCGIETQPLVHIQRSSRPRVVNERSRLSPNESARPARSGPSPELPGHALPFPDTCSPITPRVVVQCIDKKRARTPPPPVPLRQDDSRRRRYETRHSPGLVMSGSTFDSSWDDALYDDLHRKLMSVPASGGFTSDPTAIYGTGPYVHFTKDKETSGYPEKNEYFYPSLDAVSGLPPTSSQRSLMPQNAYRDYRNLTKTDVQPPVPPLPIKPHQRHGTHRAKEFPRKSSDLCRSDSANFKSKCTYCGEYFSPKENRRGVCADGPDPFRNCAKSCVCPAAAIVYHCADDEDDVAMDLWTCGACDQKSCRQWTVLTIVCLLLPCMWCFLPMRACHRCGVACGCCGSRHQAALPLPSNV